MPRRNLDRQILSIAVPALGALAAEPLYLLADTAIIGHVGTPELAALALAATVLTTLVGLCVFLTYGTTVQVSRFRGAGNVEAAAGLAAQALWLALIVGAVLLAACVVLAEPIVAALGGEGEVANLAERYLQISALGLPWALIALAGQGYLRGVGDLRTPLIVIVAAQVVNVLLELLFVYGFGWGLDGSAAGTVIAQIGAGTVFAARLLRAPADHRRPERERMIPLLRISAELLVRSAALLLAFLLASAAVARIGPAPLAAHQIAFQLFVLSALVLDAVAIAAQILVSRALGAGDIEVARDAGRRTLWWSVVAGFVFSGVLLLGRNVIPQAFTSDPEVLKQASEMWTVFALLLPIAAAVFALDGMLIGAGDTRFLAIAMVVAGPLVFVPVLLVASTQSWGIVGAWWALCALILARFILLSLRWRSGRWVVVGLAPTTT